jgi:lipopolysaccharide transport system ATP-binding protein
MSDVAIKVENLSKQYRLGLVGTGTLSHDINRFWAKVRGKEDPYLKISEVNDRTTKFESDYVWALKDINFEVKKGEVLGIIGRNGAGKSTLLKILSRVTSPSTGSIKMNGRVGSLLEVGTGFHPELTGRENIFLNGAILGMRKWEIQNKLDEIVDFSGCEKYLDTPVKRYSSGMKVRLGFAVAAHLEPEILIVDEVLAVGDAEFQKKCIGKMQDVSKNDGRTILFVSHNFKSITELCNRALSINVGKVNIIGNTQTVIESYYKELCSDNKIKDFFSFESSQVDIYDFSLRDESMLRSNNYKFTDNIKIKIDYLIKFSAKSSIHFNISIKRIDGVIVTTFTNRTSFGSLTIFEPESIEIILEKNKLMPGQYSIDLVIGEKGTPPILSKEDIIIFNIVESNINQAIDHPYLPGVISLDTSWRRLG